MPKKTYKKMSEARKKEWGLGIRKGGWKHTKEWSEKMSKVRKGKKPYEMTNEIRAKISETRKGKHNSPKTEFKKGMKKTSTMYRFPKGDKHPNWQGGEPYGPRFKLLREKIRKRDNLRCQECFRHQDELYSKSGRKYKLHIHHIDYNKKNNNLNNLISLCRSCHLQTNFKRSNWTNYFSNKLQLI